MKNSVSLDCLIVIYFWCSRSWAQVSDLSRVALTAWLRPLTAASLRTRPEPEPLTPSEPESLAPEPEWGLSGPGNTGQTPDPGLILWHTAQTGTTTMRPSLREHELHVTFVRFWSSDTLDFSLMHHSPSFQSIYLSKRRILSILSICHNTTISGNNLINLSKF